MRLADVLTWTDFNFPDAEREYRRTLELDPNDSMARVFYGHVLLILGRPGEAMPQIDRAVAIDPLDVGVRVQCAFALVFARRYNEALAQANEVLRMQPGHAGAIAVIYYAGHMKQQFADVVTAAATIYEWRGRQDLAQALKKDYAESGYARALRQAADVELAKYGGEPGVPMDAAENYAMAGDRARALDMLERAYAEGEPNIVYIGVNPIFDPLRAEPLFQALLRKMNLPLDSPPPTSK